MLHRPRNSAFPVVNIRRHELPRAVGVSKLKHAAKCAFPSKEPFSSLWREDLVPPPACADFSRKGVHLATPLLRQRRDIVLERILRLRGMSKAGFQEICSYLPSVQVYVEHAQPCDTPAGRDNLRFIGDTRCEPACSVSRTTAVFDFAVKHRRTWNGNPFACRPCQLRVVAVGPRASQG